MMHQEELGQTAYLQVPTILKSWISDVSFLGLSFRMKAGPCVASLSAAVGIYRTSKCSQISAQGQDTQSGLDTGK